MRKPRKTQTPIRADMIPWRIMTFARTLAFRTQGVTEETYEAYRKATPRGRKLLTDLDAGR